MAGSGTKVGSRLPIGSDIWWLDLELQGMSPVDTVTALPSRTLRVWVVITDNVRRKLSSLLDYLLAGELREILIQRRLTVRRARRKSLVPA